MGDPLLFTSAVVVTKLLDEVIKAAQQAYYCKDECKELAAKLEDMEPLVTEIVKNVKNGNEACMKWLTNFTGILHHAEAVTKDCIQEMKGGKTKRMMKFWRWKKLPLLVMKVSSQIEEARANANLAALGIILSRNPPSITSAFGFVKQGTPSLIVGVEKHFNKLKTSILEGIRKDKACYFGLQGRGGAGKTLLAQMLNNDADIQETYGKDSIMWITVGLDAKICDLYGKMGNSSILDDGVSEQFKLIMNQEEQRTYLKNAFAEKKVLLILDDVWEKQCDHHDMMYWLDIAKAPGSTTLITSRSESILRKAHAAIEAVLSLPKEESWELFCSCAFGSETSPATIPEKLARDVCEECQGLPLALKVIGSAMVDKLSKEEWRSALHLLQDSKPILDSNVDDELFGRLQLISHSLQLEAKAIVSYYLLLDSQEKKGPIEYLEGLLNQESSKTEGEGSETGVEGPKIEGEGPKTWGEGPWTRTMSKTLELVVSTIKLLEGARPSTIDNSPGNSSLFMLILSQLRRSGSLLNDLPVESILDWHDFIFEELQWAVNRTSTLVGHSRGISMIPTEARGEYFLETLLDLRWWTWQIEFQAGMDQGFRPFHYYSGAFEGVLEAKSPSGDSMTRSLPSYSLERFQKAEIERRFVEVPQLKSKGKSEEENAINTRIRKAELPLFIIKALRPTTIQDAKKPSSIQDYLEIDLTQDLLGASSTGYVIRTTCSDGEEGFCALKKINTMDDKPPDLAKLWHPHVVHLIHHWSEETALHDVARGWIPKSTFMTFLVMELMDCDLATLISRTKKTGIAPFSLRFGVDVMLQIAKGMLYLHEMGVSHPHLKCENVLCKLQNKTETFREGEGRVNLGDVLVKLGGFGCSRPATLHNKKWDVFCFGLTCLEILTGKEYWSEDIYGADASSIPTIPETTPLILKHCIASCLDKELALNFSEVVMLLLLAQLQIMRTYEGGTMLSIESLHIENEQTRNQDSASFSRSYGNLQEMFHVRELHPQLGAVPTPVQITLIFFHGFPKVSEEWRLTWMTRDNKLLWPQKWLPEDLDGNIRVLSLSFDDTLDVSSNRIQPDSEISKALLQTLVLRATWKLGEIEHAIVLVGHGFGGVILKLLVTEAQSFVRNAQQNSKDFQDVEVMRCKRFLERLASVVFYSVPHDHAPTNTEFKNYILGCSKTRVLQRSSMVKSLRGDDRFIGEMIQLSEDFENALPHKTKVLAFLEGEPMSKNLFLVTEKSYAGVSCTLHKVEKDNHFEVCRPDSKSHTGYKALLLHIQQHMFSIPTDEIVKEPGGAAGYS